MKIIYFNYLYDLYGVSIGSTIKAIRLLDELQHLGHEVKIFWRKSQPSNKQGIKKKSKEYLKKWLSRYLHDPKQLLLNIKYIYEENKIINQEKPDLIISRLDLYLFSALFLAKIKKIPIITEADAPTFYEASEFHSQYWSFPKLARLIEKYNLIHSDMNFCVSNTAKEYFIKQGIPSDKISVITNGADIDKFDPSKYNNEIKKKYNLKDKILIGFVGSFHFWHGIDNLTKLIKNIVNENSNVVFLLVGHGGPMEAKLKDFIKNENLEKMVVFTGYIHFDEIPAYISSMDIVLAPYPELNFFYYSPVKIFEYMASGKPIVTTKIGQIAEIIQNGYNGLLCEPGDIDEMINQVQKLIIDENLRSYIGNNARTTIVSEHTWNKKAQQLYELVEKAL